MIFVTVGTDDHTFDRLILHLDRLVEVGQLQTPVFAQIGPKATEPKYVEWARMLSYTEMQEKVRLSDKVVCQGGPGTIFTCLKNGKIPIVVPRLSKYVEAIDDHQVDFVRHMSSYNKILAVYEIDELLGVIESYEQQVFELKSHMSTGPGGMTEGKAITMSFCEKLDEQISSLF